MLNYEEFQEEILKKIISYLPVEYGDYQAKLTQTPKVNEMVETINVLPPNGEGITPNIYVGQFYQYYKKCGNLGETLKFAAETFVNSMQHVQAMCVKIDGGNTRENIVMNLINTERNPHILDHCPARRLMDLSIIYRWVITSEEGSFSGAVITQDIAKELNLTEEDLYQMASKNTSEILHPLIEKVDDEVYLLTNQFRRNGAVTMLYPDSLANIAKEWDEDLFVLPASIHEVIVVPVPTQTIDRLEVLVNKANDSVVNDGEILSDSVYYFDRKKNELILAKKK